MSTDLDRRSRSARLVLATSCLGFFLVTLDATIVSLSLPSVGRDLGGSVADLQWVVDAYALLFASLLLSAGALTDRIGTRRAYLSGLVAFTVASVLCGSAAGIAVLIAARAVQGAAAALMLPSSLAMVRQAFSDPAARTRAIAVWAAAGGVAVAAGPVAGGALTAGLGWRAIFLVNAPLGVLGALGLLRGSGTPGRPAPFDVPGQLTAALAMASLTFAVIEGGARGWGAPVVVSALVAAALAAAAFLAVEARATHPVVPLRLFRSATVSVCAAIGFFLNFATYGLIFVLSLYLQREQHVTPLSAGLMFLPMTAVITATNLVAGRMAARHGPRRPIVIGQLVLLLGLLGLALGGFADPVALLLLLVPVGVGGGLTVPPITTALLEAIDAASAGLASGILNAGRQMGGALAVALFGALVSGGAGFAAGLRGSLLTAVVALVCTTVAAVRYLPRTAA